MVGMVIVIVGDCVVDQCEKKKVDCDNQQTKKSDRDNV